MSPRVDTKGLGPLGEWGSTWFGAVKRGQTGSRAPPGREESLIPGPLAMTAVGQNMLLDFLSQGWPWGWVSSKPRPSRQKTKALSKSRARLSRHTTGAEAESHPVLLVTHGKARPRERAALIRTKNPLDDDPASDNKLIEPVTLCMTNYAFRLSMIPKQEHRRQQNGRKRNALISSRTPNKKETEKQNLVPN